MGEVFANFFGLTQSKYQWVIDAAERDKEQEIRRKLVERARRELRLKDLIEKEKAKAAALENGEAGEAGEEEADC
jgi:hypothetical protein